MGIGTLLVERGMLSDEQLARAVDEQVRSGERLDQVLVRLGLTAREDVLSIIGQQFAMPIVDLSTIEVKPDILSAIPARVVFKQQCVPIEGSGDTLRIATCDPYEITTFDELSLLIGRPIELVLADERDLRKFIRAHYGVAGDTLDQLIDEDAADIAVVEGDSAEIAEAQEASVIKLVNDLIIEAIRERATDVHIEPYEEALSIRYRIDGVLCHAGVPATVNRFRSAIISRLKIMSNLNIAEKRVPQDGRITLRLKGREYDLRVSVIPMLHGEGIVLRVLDKHTAMLSLDDLGMPPAVLERWDALIRRPHGILLVTGPTGSGKSTTLYASLNRIVSDEIKAVTIEDPVEYHCPGVSQIQVRTQVGLSFAAGLRATLRHDPDIIMIGEIRDLETAQAAVQASLTGHLVFSTLHTNDAAGATTRLLDMGVEPYLVSSSVEGVLAQRLVRVVCSHCCETVRPNEHELPGDFKFASAADLKIGRGCRDCRQTGYLGRQGIFELLTLNETAREMIMERANARQIAHAALGAGDLLTLRRNGYARVLEGVTTLAEIARVTQDAA